jgi:hypothetical protein
MTETITSVKIKKYILERLREQYPEMSFNEIMEVIATEESFKARQIYPPQLVGEVAIFISDMKERFPNISIREIIEKCKKQVIISPITTL